MISSPPPSTPTIAPMTTSEATPPSTREFGRRVDELAELEEERRFLLGSLKDLEREFAAGDVDLDDYTTLKDGYTVRAASVLRQIEDGRRTLAVKRPRNWKRVVAICVAIAVVAAGIGFALAQAWGERNPGDEITGARPGDDVRATLASARVALGDNDFETANRLFLAALEADRERGQENPEALTYFAWTLALGALANPDQEAAAPQYDAALVLLDRAIEADPNYADPYCYAAIVEANFRDDPDAALTFLDGCESQDPPAAVADLVAAFAERIRTAASSVPD